MFDRVPATAPRLMRALAIAVALAQGGISVTGSVVRVTGSGLGCRSWPPCFAGSLFPDPRFQVALLHQWVEFGNRLFTGAVSVVAVACLAAALATRPRRRRVTVLAAFMPAGVLLQAVLGGITVLTGLAWWTVAAHFLVSMVLVWLSVLLVCATSQSAGPPGLPLPAAGRRLLALTSGMLGALLIAGTGVTAAGPHAGDANTPRLGTGVALMVHLHADLVVAYLALLVGLGFLLRAVGASRSLTRRHGVLVASVLAQGGLGAVQYALGVPELLVSLHVFGACTVTAAAAGLWAARNGRPGLSSRLDVRSRSVQDARHAAAVTISPATEPAGSPASTEHQPS